MKSKSLSKAIMEIQEDYIRRRDKIKEYIPQSGITDILQQRIFDYSNFIRTLETIREAILQEDKE